MAKPTSRRNLQLNPAFANAHGLSEATDNADPWEQFDKELTLSNSTTAKLSHGINEARKTGKLILNSIELTLPLPSAIFDLRNEVLANLDGRMDGNDKSWECYGEEMLTMLDLSDNDMSTNAKAGENDRFSKEQTQEIPAVVDVRIGCYSALQTLRIRNCKLDDLPWETIGEKLNALTVLDAPGNHFTTVPLSQLPETIKSLYLGSNHIHSLGEAGDDINLPELFHLDLGNNALTFLPSKLDSARLQHLILARNKIASISLEFLNSSRYTLKTLDLGQNQLTATMDFSQHAELQILELRYNKMKQMPKIHPNLIRLGMSFNDISCIAGLFSGQCDEEGKTDDGSWFRSNLNELHLETNKLEKNLHGATLEVMTKLSFLDISHNALETIPHVVGYLRNMNNLLLDGNPMRMLRSYIKYKSSGGLDTAKLLESLRNKGPAPDGPGYFGSTYESELNNDSTPKNVTEARTIVRRASTGKRVLDISGRGFSGGVTWQELLDALTTVTSDSNRKKITYGSLVSSWKMSDGKITTFGNEWAEAMPSLTVFDGHRNQIDSLPANFSQLSLETLILQKNSITSSIVQNQICAPDSNLSASLVNLDLSANRLAWIPSSLFDLPKLASLNLSHNRIKTLIWECDEETGEGRGWRHGLISLQHLDLSNNSISDLGFLALSLSGCGQLRTLLLNNNAIYHIPLEFGLLEQLTKIDLLGNSQRKVGVRVLTQGCSKILEYLRERMTPEELQEAKENHSEIQAALREEMGGDTGSAHGEITYAKSQDSVQSVQRESQDSVQRVQRVEARQAHPVETNLHSQVEDKTEIIDTLKSSIRDLSEQLENLNISQAKRFALKKELAMERSKLLREEKTLR